MTDVGPYGFGIFTQLTGISFPAGSYAIFLCTASDDPGGQGPAVVTFSDPRNIELPFGESTFTLIDSTGTIGPGFDETEDVHWGETLLATTPHGQVVPTNWIAFPLKDEFSVLVTDSVTVQQIGMVFACVTTRPDFSTFKLTAGFSELEFTTTATLSWNAKNGANSVTYPLAVTGQLPQTGKDIAAPNIGFFWQVISPNQPFVVDVKPANPAESEPAEVTFTPDQGFYD